MQNYNKEVICVKKLRMARVDIQVSIFMAIIVSCSIACSFGFYYHLTYNDMIDSLKDRVLSIYNFLEKDLDKTSFIAINSIEDQSQSAYIEMKTLLEDVKRATDVMYLYTAKQDAEGQFIYVVDGLSASNSDFRNAGDPIEEEIVEDMARALTGEIVWPKNIKDTGWGKIFITYFPIHDGAKVIGVLGIEIEAAAQYNTYRKLWIITPIIALITCLIAMVLAVLFFKRISNPSYKDLANTDQLTGLKNRNAYDVDLKNIVIRDDNMVGFIVMDLNNLKVINDTMGHQVGDDYICYLAEVLSLSLDKQEVAYRVGGDEFVVLLKATTESALIACQEKIMANFKENKGKYSFEMSLALGYALYNPERDGGLYDTCRRADMAMYDNKKLYHQFDGGTSC